jgi:chaperone required for assembly of F1-ATPase
MDVDSVKEEYSQKSTVANKFSFGKQSCQQLDSRMAGTPMSKSTDSKMQWMANMLKDQNASQMESLKPHSATTRKPQIPDLKSERHELPRT